MNAWEEAYNGLIFGGGGGTEEGLQVREVFLVVCCETTVMEVDSLPGLSGAPRADDAGGLVASMTSSSCSSWDCPGEVKLGS